MILHLIHDIVLRGLNVRAVPLASISLFAFLGLTFCICDWTGQKTLFKGQNLVKKSVKMIHTGTNSDGFKQLSIGSSVVTDSLTDKVGCFHSHTVWLSRSLLCSTDREKTVCRAAVQVPDVFILTLIHCTLHILHLFFLRAVCYSTHVSLSSSVSASLFLKSGLTPNPPPNLSLWSLLSLSQGLISVPLWNSL